MRPVPSPTITKYGKPYLDLHCSEVDGLCQWVYDMRESGIDPGDDKVELVDISIIFLHSYVFLHLP